MSADSPRDGVLDDHPFDSFSGSAPPASPPLRSSPEAHAGLLRALKGAQALSQAAAQRCKTARVMLASLSDRSDAQAGGALEDASEDLPEDGSPDARTRLQIVHTYAVQVIWQLRSIAADLDQTLQELEASPDQ